MPKFVSDAVVPAEVYGPAWNGSQEAPTKDALYDKIESMGGVTWPLDHTGAATDDLLTSRVTSDAQLRFTVNHDGKVEWGDGATALDVNLYRSAANTLRTDDTFIAAVQLQLPQTGSTGGLLIGGDATLYRISSLSLRTNSEFVSSLALIANYGPTGTNQARIHITESGGNPVIYFGRDYDTVLYRSAEATLKTDGVFQTSSLVLSEITAPATPAAGTVALYTKADGKAYIKDDTGAETDLTAAGSISAPLALQNTPAASDAVTVKVTGDAIPRLTVDADGSLRWTDGTSAIDGANLYRVAANSLKTDGAFVAGLGIYFPEVAAPGTPAAGHVVTYAKADGKLYIKDDTGVETDLTGGGGGAPIYVHNGTSYIEVDRAFFGPYNPVDEGFPGSALDGWVGGTPDTNGGKRSAVKFYESNENWAPVIASANVWQDIDPQGTPHVRPSDIVIPNVSVGDTVSVTPSMYFTSAASGLYLECFTIVNGTAVNKFTPLPANTGPSVWGVWPSMVITVGNPQSYIVKASDIEDGCVRLRFRVTAGTSSSTRTAFGTFGIVIGVEGNGPSGDSMICFDGQSFQYAPVAPGVPAKTFTQRVMAGLTSKRTWFQNGRSGTTYATRATTVATRIDAMVGNTPNPIYINVAGQSDILASMTAAAIMTAAESNADARRAAGWTTIVEATVPHSTSYSGPQNTVRLAYNTLLLADANNKFDAVVDLAARSEMQNGADTTYFYDGLHPTAAGAQVMADEILETLATLGIT